MERIATRFRNIGGGTVSSPPIGDDVRVDVDIREVLLAEIRCRLLEADSHGLRRGILFEIAEIHEESRRRIDVT
jgi:hypothetical protein